MENLKRHYIEKDVKGVKVHYAEHIEDDNEETNQEEEKIYYVKCGECGAEVPSNEVYDNGNYSVCKKCL
ncbi:MAG: hypothetical protein HY097_04215 [Nitrospinae bacterium]|nr:hypothetical protein [Nitrospinota bacterium]MBI3814214.1 hypothetical protein [Nitrospinota bacterium]